MGRVADAKRQTGGGGQANQALRPYRHALPTRSLRVPPPRTGRERRYFFARNAAIASTVWRTLASMPAQSFA